MAHVNDPPRDRCTCPPGWIGWHHWSCTGEKVIDWEAIENLTNALVNDILEMSDEEIRAEFVEDGHDPEQHAAEMRALVVKAVATERRRRRRSNRRIIGSPSGGTMTRLSWDKAQRRRRTIQWQRAGSPLPNRVTDASEYWLVFTEWRQRLKRRKRAHGHA